MTIGTSLLILTVGAILRWAVADNIQGVDLSTAGLILLIVGAIGILVGLFLNFRDEEWFHSHHDV